MTVAFTLTISDGNGVDTSFLFPGLRHVKWMGTSLQSYGGNVEYSNGDSSYPVYQQQVIADPARSQISDYGHGMQGQVQALTLAVQANASSSFVSIAHLSVDFPADVPQYFEVGDSLALTPTSMLNVVSFYDSVTFKVVGNAGADKIYGSAYADILDGKGGADTMIGGDGNDRFYVDSAADVVVETAGGGSDTVQASVKYALKAGVEVERLLTDNTNLSKTIALSGNEFAQRVEGNQGANTLSGLGGNDTLSGYGGNDTLSGGDGKDALTGGLGNDSFVFDAALGGGNVDTITDFHNASGDNDAIRLENAIFAKLTATGSLNQAFFAANAKGTAADGNDYVVYNTTTGALSYDADGSGAGHAIQFATLTGHPTLTTADILVI